MIFLLLQFRMRLCPPHGRPLVSHQRSELWRLPRFFLDISHPTPIKDWGLTPSICPDTRKCITPGKNWKAMKICWLLHSNQDMRDTHLYPKSANIVRCQVCVKQDLDLISEAQRSFYLMKLCAFKEEEGRWGSRVCWWDNLKKRLWIKSVK